MERRIILLNALPLNAFPSDWDNFAITVYRVSTDYLKSAIKKASEIKCYIRHPATVELLKKLLEVELKPSAELYKYTEGDSIFVITLKTPERGKEATEVRQEDIEVYYVEAEPGICR